MVTMKRALVVVAAAFALASTSALAQGLKMSDEQLDAITAAGSANGAFSLVVINNAGKANVARNIDPENLSTLENNITCINCGLLGASEGGTGGVIVVVNRKFPVTSPLIRCVGRGVAGLC